MAWEIITYVKYHILFVFGTYFFAEVIKLYQTFPISIHFEVTETLLPLLISPSLQYATPTPTPCCLFVPTADSHYIYTDLSILARTRWYSGPGDGRKGFQLDGWSSVFLRARVMVRGRSSLLAPSSTFPQTEFKNSPFSKSIQFRVLDFPRAFGDIKTVFFFLFFFHVIFIYRATKGYVWRPHMNR